MSKRKKKKKHEPKAAEAELNIMPFIDIFSMLNVFLLVSATFINIGLIRVQVPFLTNAPPPKDKPKRSLEINVGVEKEQFELETRWTQAPVEEDKQVYKFNKADIEKFHDAMVSLRSKHPEFDKVTVFSEDDVPYKKLVRVLDGIKVRQKDDPVFTEVDKKSGLKKEVDYIYRKVVMGSVVL